MNRNQEIKQALSVYVEAGLPDYGRGVTVDRTRIYMEALKPLSDEELKRGLGGVMAECDHFPTPAEIIRIGRAGRPIPGALLDTATRKFCVRCDHTGFIYTGRGVKPCSCRPWLPPSRSGPDRAMGGGLRQIGEGVGL